MARFITFRFDDGFLAGCRKAALYLSPSPASFFLVTGLTLATHQPDDLHLTSDKDFGSLDEWRELAQAGHDIQLHSVTHRDFQQISLDDQLGEIIDSLEVICKIHDGPYVFCFPYNSLTGLKLKELGLHAAGFETKTSDYAVSFNLLDDKLDLFRLRSWAVRERHFDNVVGQLEFEVPDESWTILAFHSLDGEGHEPWSSVGFIRLVEAVRAIGFEIVSAGGMVAQLSTRAARGRECNAMD